MEDKDIRLKQAAKIYLKYVLEQVFFDLGSNQANADFKRFLSHINKTQSIDRPGG